DPALLGAADPCDRQARHQGHHGLLRDRAHRRALRLRRLAPPVRVMGMPDPSPTLSSPARRAHARRGKGVQTLLDSLPLAAGVYPRAALRADPGGRSAGNDNPVASGAATTSVYG